MMNTTTEPNDELEDSLISLESKILMWVLCAVCALTSIVGFLGNGFVLYFAHSHKSEFGAFRYLNKVVKHLAVADLMYGVLAAPLQMLYWTQGTISY